MALLAINNGGANDFLSTVQQSGYCNSAWVIDARAQWSGGSTTGAGSIAYCLSSVAGATTNPPFTWAAINPGFSGVELREYSFNGTSVVLDGGAVPIGTVNNTFANPTQPGVALTIIGANDLIIQTTDIASTSVASVSGPYGNFDGTFGGMADLLNTGTASIPTWTGGGSGVSRGNAIALTEITSPASGALNPNSKFVGNSVLQ